jgi:hypothetical protein
MARPTGCVGPWPPRLGCPGDRAAGVGGARVETAHGTATLFAALDVLTGKVIGQCLPRHRYTEFLKLLRTIG